MKEDWVKGKPIKVIRRKFRIGNIPFEAIPVEHSIKAPAVMIKFKLGGKTIIYAPDILYTRYKREFKGVDLYIGDGSALKKSIVRKKNDQIYGHASIRTQLSWCKKNNIPLALFTHSENGL